jgi:transposase
LGLKSKNDSIDAKGLAQMGAEQSLNLWHPLGKYFYTLRILTRHHQNLQEQKTLFTNQLHALKYGMYRSKDVEKQLQKMVDLIDRQIEQVEDQIKLHLGSNQQVLEKVNNIIAIKGVGMLTVATLLAETNGFILFENARQLVSYAGYDVVENQSGKHNGKTRISKKGNSHIRRCLFMPALSVVTHKQKPFLLLYKRTFEKHHVKMKSYVAVQKKLLTTIFALWKRNEVYDENHSSKSKEQEPELSLCSSAKAEGVGIENKVALT